MTREELSHYEVMLLSQGITGIQKAIHMEIAYNLYLSELQATIEAQEIIIKDKTAIMEAMAKSNSCEGCTYHPLNSNDPYDLACASCKRDGNDNFELHV